jgi:hypothetical protein
MMHYAVETAEAVETSKSAPFNQPLGSERIAIKVQWGWVQLCALLLLLCGGTGCCNFMEHYNALTSKGAWILNEGVVQPSSDVRFSAEHIVVDDAEFQRLYPALRCMRPRSLGLLDEPITDVSLELIRKLKTINTLYLSNTHVTNAGLLTLRDMPNLSRIYVRQGQFSDHEMAEVENRLGPRIEIQQDTTEQPAFSYVARPRRHGG